MATFIFSFETRNNSLKKIKNNCLIAVTTHNTTFLQTQTVLQPYVKPIKYLSTLKLMEFKTGEVDTVFVMLL